MKTRKELLKSKGYWVAKWQVQIFNEIKKYQQKNGLNDTDFANKIGVTKGYISQIKNGNFDHKISKLIGLSLSVNKVPILTFEDIETVIFNDEHSLPGNTREDMDGYKSLTIQTAIQPDYKPSY
ncbi:MAG: helix-turn-helix transcriptional regulator [Bacteroidota bacterium]|nr:helix-turn-helix transcriptional regulator [Bacteroidota bacterium]